YRLNVGKQSAGKAETALVYVNSSEVSEPLAVRRARLDMAFKDVKEFLPGEMLRVSALNTAFAQFEGPNHQPLFALEKKGEMRWFFAKPAELGEADPDGERPAPDAPEDRGQAVTGVKDLLEAVGGMQVEPNTDTVTLDASEDALTTYGVGRDNYTTLRVE